MSPASASSHTQQRKASSMQSDITPTIKEHEEHEERENKQVITSDTWLSNNVNEHGIAYREWGHRNGAPRAEHTTPGPAGTPESAAAQGTELSS